jgi:hypothetical protein
MAASLLFLDTDIELVLQDWLRAAQSELIGVKRPIVTRGSALPSLYDAAEEYSSGETDRERRRNSQPGVAPQAAGCVIQEFFGRITALPGRARNNIHAFTERIGDRSSCARRLVS